MKILRPFTGTGAVFFPVGTPPKGTCQFATKACLASCYAVDAGDMNFDEEVRISDCDKQEIYNWIMNSSIGVIRDRFLFELDGLQTDILHWFGSGDCQIKDQSHIQDIINSLLDDSVIQMGFTRNISLWRANIEIFALAVESIEDVHSMSEPGALFSIPQYNKQTSIMVTSKGETRGGLCGPLICSDRWMECLDHYINCQTCRRLNTGCFDKE